MNTLRMPTREHEEFDHLCARVDDFEPLPTVATTPPPEGEREAPAGEEQTPLDGLILAGLVAPV